MGFSWKLLEGIIKKGQGQWKLNNFSLACLAAPNFILSFLVFFYSWTNKNKTWTWRLVTYIWNIGFEPPRIGFFFSDTSYPLGLSKVINQRETNDSVIIWWFHFCLTMTYRFLNSGHCCFKCWNQMSKHISGGSWACALLRWKWSHDTTSHFVFIITYVIYVHSWKGLSVCIAFLEILSNL